MPRQRNRRCEAIDGTMVAYGGVMTYNRIYRFLSERGEASTPEIVDHLINYRTTSGRLAKQVPTSREVQNILAKYKAFEKVGMVSVTQYGNDRHDVTTWKLTEASQ